MSQNIAYIQSAEIPRRSDMAPPPTPGHNSILFRGASIAFTIDSEGTRDFSWSPSPFPHHLDPRLFDPPPPPQHQPPRYPSPPLAPSPVGIILSIERPPVAPGASIPPTAKVKAPRASTIPKGERTAIRQPYTPRINKEDEELMFNYYREYKESYGH